MIPKCIGSTPWATVRVSSVAALNRRSSARFSALLKTVAELHKEMISISKDEKTELEIEESENENNNQVSQNAHSITNNAIYVGNTRDLLDVINQ